MSSGEARYSFRRAFPDVLERGRANKVQMEAYLDGARVAPTSGSLLLVNSSGDTVSSPAVTVPSGIAIATVPAIDLPATLAYGSGYRELWTLAMPDGSTPTVPREACVARFRLYPAAGDADLLSEYPGLLTEFGGAVGSLQSFIDEAWNEVIERLWGLDIWPEVIVSESQLRRPLRERAYYGIFRALYRRTSGSPRWEVLMREHSARYDAAWAAMSWRRDLEQSGVADDERRKGASAVLTPNVPPYSVNDYRDWRW